MQTKLFMYFCIKKYIGTHGEVCRVKNILKPPVVYGTDRSMAVVPVLFLFCVALWFILQALDVLKSSCALCYCVSSFFLAVITSLGEEEAGLCASCPFVCLCCM